MSTTTNDTTTIDTGSDPTTSTMEQVLSTIRASRDAMSVNKVFGDPYQVDGATVIPVARVRGGAGGGAGEGSGIEPAAGDEDGTDVESQTTTGSDGNREGSGLGAGFGVLATPVGVYEIRDQGAVWKPAVDVNRLVKGFQVLAAIVAICLTLVRLRQQ